MKNYHGFSATWALAGIAAAVSAAPAAAGGGLESGSGDAVMDETAEADRPNRDLPFAQGLRFDTLDAYLAHLERRGATGVPFYRRVGRDRYQLVSGRGRRAPPPVVTRAELMREFGFTR